MASGLDGYGGVCWRGGPKTALPVRVAHFSCTPKAIDRHRPLLAGSGICITLPTSRLVTRYGYCLT